MQARAATVPGHGKLIEQLTRPPVTTGKLLNVDRRVLESYSGSDGGTPAPLVIRPGTGRVRTLEPGRAPSNGRSSSPQRAATHHAGRFLTTVLMTDIVGSTSTVARLGDRRWRELLADHYEDCRAQIERAGGELAETTGDGVVAIFDGATRAVRAGMAIQAGARQRGVAVRVGVHTGECERMEEGLVGIAVHIAARVCALGRADEVTTTGTVRDVAIGSMLAFEPRGRHELKGVPGDWTVFSATDAD
jgi:class 3 adenylate cyclase